VDKLSEWVVCNEGEILELMTKGAQNRTTGATKLNDVSSRSHAVFIIILEHSQSNQQAVAGRSLNETVSQSRHLGMAAAMPDMHASVKVGLLHNATAQSHEAGPISGAILTLRAGCCGAQRP
jgi:hypothetical protein